MNAFTLSRIAFVIIDGRILVKSSVNAQTCKDWMLGMGNNEERYKNAIRGYMTPERLQFFTGEDYRPVTVLNNTYIARLCTWYSSHFRYRPLRICNGVRRGRINEVWDPISEINIECINQCIPPKVIEVGRNK